MDEKSPFVGLTCVTSASLLFGIVAAIVKYVRLPALVALQLRSVIQWGCSLLIILWRRYSNADGPNGLFHNFFGPSGLRLTLMLRATLYWGFIVCWWSALAYMPLGDATAMVYTGPLFTGFFGWLVLGEQLKLRFFICMGLSLPGLILITQPEALFGCSPKPCKISATYAKGVAYALTSAFVAGMLPMCVRLSRECHWSTVEHTSAFAASFVLTPIGLVLESTQNDIFSAQNFSSRNFEWLLLVSVIGFCGLGLQTYGYQKEEVSKAGLMTFLEIPFAYSIQCEFFHQTVDPVACAGIFLVVASAFINGYCRFLDHVAQEAAAEKIQVNRSETMPLKVDM